MSSFYAAFPDSTNAERMVRHLMEDGYELDRISLVIRDERNIETSARPSVGDASFFVGREDDPTHELLDQGAPNADYDPSLEFKTGMAGIDTSNRAESGETVDQLDDSQWRAEDMLEPRQETSAGEHERQDLHRAVRTGFPTPMPSADRAESAGIPNESELDRSFEAIPVPGLGTIMGGGDLATAAFDWRGSNGNPDPTAFLTYLQDEGVPPGPANELLQAFGNGGAIIAVEMGPESDQDALESVSQQYGSITSGWFGAPRF